MGGTTLADPARGGKPAGRPTGSPTSPGGDGYAPRSELDVSTMPDVDTEACGKSVTYPADAQQNGIAGEVRLRVELDASGHVHAARVLSGLGHGLDQAALDAIKHRCRFTPAKDKSGTPVPFVIQSYSFHFELPH
jgi:protein TonB